MIFTFNQITEVVGHFTFDCIYIKITLKLMGLAIAIIIHSHGMCLF